MKKLILILLGILVMSFFLSDLTCAQPKTIKIGWIGPLTGPSAEGGIGNRKGCILAMEEWNAKGGVFLAEYKSKIPVEIIFEDAQSKPEVGVSLGEKLITRDKVHFLIGDAFNSSVTMAVMELASKYGIPIMSIQSISDEITKKIAKDPERYWSFWKQFHGSTAFGRNIFYVYQYLIEKKAFTPKKKTIASVIEDTDYGRSNVAETKKQFEGSGWKSVAMETVPLAHMDFYPQLSKIKALEPDILVTSFASVSSGIAFAKQFRELEVKSSHVATYYPSIPEFIPQAGKAADYLFFMATNLESEHNPKHKEFAEKIKKRWNVTSNLDFACGYDAVYNIFDSIERAGSLEPKKIVEAISRLNRKGLLATWAFDQSNHQAKDGPDFIPISATQIVDGKYVAFWPPAIAWGEYVVQPWTK